MSSSKIEKLLSLKYELKGSLFGYNVYIAEQSIKEDYMKILNVSKNTPIETSGILILHKNKSNEYIFFIPEIIPKDT